MDHSPTAIKAIALVNSPHLFIKWRKDHPNAGKPLGDQCPIALYLKAFVNDPNASISVHPHHLIVNEPDQAVLIPTPKWAIKYVAWYDRTHQAGPNWFEHM